MSAGPGARGRWQRADGLCEAVLHQVFGWLSASELCAARRVCGAWRRAGSAPVLWRRLLRRVADPNLHDDHLHALADYQVSWENEYIACFGGFVRVCADYECVSEAVFVCAEEGGRGRVALVTGTGALEVWAGAQAWRRDLRARGWARALRCHWAPAAPPPRLLVLGALALVPAWELLVVELDEEGEGHVCARSRCSPGAGGCWAGDGEAFFSFELSSFAPGVACTTVWLNTATQETQSEYAGVLEPVLRVYNEHGEHFTHGAVVRAPLEPGASPCARDTDDAPAYLRATLTPPVLGACDMRVLVLTSGCHEGGGGGVFAWGLETLHVGPLCARGELRERVRARAAAPAPAPAPDPPPPGEREVRALCTPPLAEHALSSPPTGLVPHSTGRCVWVALGVGDGGGALCLALPSLLRLRLLSAAPTPRCSAPLSLYYTQPAVSSQYVVIPSGEGARVWSALSGVPCGPGPAGPAAGPGLCATFIDVAEPTRFIFLTPDKIYGSIRAGPGRRAVSRSCAGERPPAERAPCPPGARPPCRAPPPTSRRTGVYLACCPPPRGSRPPCHSPPTGRSLTCAHATSEATASAALSYDALGQKCGDGQDRVARRLAAAEAYRRAVYEEEVRAAAGAGAAACAPAAPYTLGGSRCRTRATDGQVYSLPCAPAPAGDCSDDRCPPLPRCVPLESDDACQAMPPNLVDPCAHRPRKFLEIARPADHSKTPSRGLTNRIMDSLNLGRGTCRNPRGERRLHTSCATTASSPLGKELDKKEDVAKLEESLKERSQLNEAGRGRVAVAGGGRATAAAGRLELGVPAGAARVCVDVSLCGVAPRLASAAGAPLAPCSSAPSGPPARGHKDSWFSSIFLGRTRDKESPCMTKARPPCPGAAAPPPPPAPRCPSPAPSPCAAPTTAPTPCKPKSSVQSPCKSKSTKFSSLLLTT